MLQAKHPAARAKLWRPVFFLVALMVMIRPAPNYGTSRFFLGWLTLLRWIEADGAKMRFC